MATTTFNLETSSSPVLYLDAFIDAKAIEDAPRICILAVHADGEVRCFSERLEVQLWSTRIGAIATEHGESTGLYVRHACIVPLDQAQKALLKGREDLLATSALADQENGAILAFFTQESIGIDHTLNLKIMRTSGLGKSHQAINMAQGRPLQEIAKSQIPEPSQMKQATNRLSFHATSGTLYQSNSDAVVVYKIIGTVARVVQDIKLDVNEVTSSLRISPALIMISATSSVSIIDTTYYSIQAQCQVTEISQADSSKSSNRRKRHATAPMSVRLLSYFASLEIVVAQHGQHLIALQLPTSTVKNSTSRKRKRESRLIDSIGRGSLAAKKTRKIQSAAANKSYSFGQSFTQIPAESTWDKNKILLDQHFAHGDQEKIEEILEEELDLNHSRAVDQRAAASLKVNIPERCKAEYLLSKGFSFQDVQAHPAQTTNHSQKTLRLCNIPRRIYRWLMQKCYISTEQLETAFRRSGLLAAPERLDPGAIFEALARDDPSMKTVLFLLQSMSSLTAAETVAALRLAIVRISESSSVNLLTNGPLSPLSSDNSPNVDAGNQMVELPSSQLFPQIQAESGTVCYKVVSACIRRLYSLSSHAVSKALKQTFSSSEIHTLVDLVRMELASNGWLAFYFDNGLDASADGQSETTKVCVVAHILNCVIDSIGSGGWLTHSSFGDDLAEATKTIVHMKAEISAALEGIMEATYLKGMLGEMLLCGKNYGTVESKAWNQLTSKVPEYRKPSDIVSVELKEDDVLPLGLRPLRTISTYKVGAGGELIKRSARDIGRLKSRMVPKYSFERILI